MIKLNGNSIPEVFKNQTLKYKERACVAYKDLKKDEYVDISWQEMYNRVQELSSYLLTLNVKKGDKIAIFSNNRPEWWIVDLAILSIGCVNVPIYATNSAEEAKYVLEHSESRICITETKEHLNKILEIKDSLNNFTDIINIEKTNSKEKEVITLSEAYKIGKKNLKKDELGEKLNSIKVEDLATIIYTSGTTGDPKGVMLTHNNFFSNVRQIMTDFEEQMDDNNTLLSFLPLSHSLERTAGYYLPLCIGAKVAFAEEFAKVVDNMKEIRPTFIVSVPRLYEKIHSTVLSNLPNASLVKRIMFSLAMSVASINLKYECENKERKGVFSFIYNIFDKLVYSKVKDALGMNNLKFAVSGGAPLSIFDAEFFIGMGIRIFEGFGLTETTPITNVNLYNKIKPGTVGPPVLDTDIRIADDGEMQIKGPQVMKGYYKNEEATKEAFTEDGFFRTGDIAVKDEDGFYIITGRIKDIIVTAGGKNISPQNIENSLKSSAYIEQVAVIGDKKKYLSALVIPAFENLQVWAKSNGINFTDDIDLVKNEAVISMISDEINKNTTQYSRVEQIRKFTILNAEWTQETGELTPSLKVKRRILEEKYKNEIEAMYPKE